MNNEQIDTALKSLSVDDSVPNWAKILINCIPNLVVERQVSHGLAEQFANFESTMANKLNDIETIKSECRILKIQVAGLRDELEELEQYGRRNSLVFHGIPENQGESSKN